MMRGQRFVGVAVGVGVLISLAGERPWAANEASLIEAVKADNLASVRAMLKTPALVNVAEADGTTALHWAARGNDIELVRLLIKAGANAKVVNRYGQSPLSFAATNGNAMILEALLKAGADPNAATKDGQTPLMDAARAGQADAIKVLAGHGATVNSIENFMGESALMWAAAEDHPEAVKALLEVGADINAKSRETKYPRLSFVPFGMVNTYMPQGGWTPLMYAARNGSLDAARMLTDKGADLNAKDPDGTAALVFAIINAHFDVATYLVEKGTDPNIQDRAGMTPLYAAVEMHSIDGDMSRPLQKIHGNAIDLVKLLFEKGAKPNLQLTSAGVGRGHSADGDQSMGAGTTALMRAAKNGDTEMIELLLAHDADPKLTQKNGSNAVMIASAPTAGQFARVRANEANCVAGIRLLVKAGVDINAQNARGETALHRAALRNRITTIKGLAAVGARLDIQNRQGLNPLDAALAVSEGRRGGSGGAVVSEATIQALRDLGAKETPPEARKVLETLAPEPQEQQ